MSWQPNAMLGKPVIIATEHGVYRGIITQVEELRSPIPPIGIQQYRTKPEPITSTLTIDITEYQE